MLGSSGVTRTQIWIIRAHHDSDLFFGVILAHNKGSSRLGCGSSGLRFGSLGLNSAQWPLRFGYWAHLDLSGLIKRLRFGRSGLILADQDSGLAHWGSLLLFRTQYLAHLDPLGVRFGPSGLMLAHQDSGLAHWGSLGLFKTRDLAHQDPLIRAHWDSDLAHLNSDFAHHSSSTHTGHRFGSSRLIGGHRDPDLAHRRSMGLRFGSSSSS